MKRLRSWWQEQSYTDQMRFAVLIGLLVSGIATAVIFSGVLSGGEWKSLSLNLGTELIGAAITFALIDLFIGTKERHTAAIETWKRDQLSFLSQLRQAELPSHKQAIITLMKSNDLLREADLRSMNLEEISFWDANMEGARLWRANLKATELVEANLMGALMRETNLEDALLAGANLQKADLGDTNLKGANLCGAKFQGATLLDANLEGVSIGEFNSSEGKQITVFDEETILPDGNRWSQDADITRFTNPDHLHFWRSDNPHSPAYEET